MYKLCKQMHLPSGKSPWYSNIKVTQSGNKSHGKFIYLNDDIHVFSCTYCLLNSLKEPKQKACAQLKCIYFRQFWGKRKHVKDFDVSIRATG